MGSTHKFSTDVSELLHVEMVKEAYRSTKWVNFEEKILLYNDRHTGWVYMIQTLEYLALRGSFESDTVRTLGMSSHEERPKSTRCARRRQAAASHASSQLILETNLKSRSVLRYSPIAVPEARARLGISELQKQTELTGRVRDMKPLSIKEAAVRFGLSDFPAIFCHQIIAIWGTHLTERI